MADNLDAWSSTGIIDSMESGSAPSGPAQARSASSQTTFFESLFGVDWSLQLPIELSGGVRFDRASSEETAGFIADHYTLIFGSGAGEHRFFVDPSSASRQRFIAACDRFAFREAGRVIGLLIGNPADWSTYYWRSAAFLPEHQGRGLLAAATAHTDRVMREAGVARIETDVAPTNYRQMRLLLRLGYIVTGSTNSERWGVLARLTKFLNADAHEAFVRRFCGGHRPSAHRGEQHAKGGEL